MTPLLITLFGAADGTLVHREPDGTDRTLFPVPAAATVALRYDEATNPDLTPALLLAWGEFRLATVNGVVTLLRNGVPVPIAPPGAAAVAAQNAATLRTRVVAQLDALDTLATAALAASALPAPAVVTSLRTFAGGSTTLTTAQLSAQLRTLAGLVADEIDRRQQTQVALANQLILAIRRTIRLAAGQLDAAD